MIESEGRQLKGAHVRPMSAQTRRVGVRPDSQVEAYQWAADQQATPPDNDSGGVNSGNDGQCEFGDNDGVQIRTTEKTANIFLYLLQWQNRLLPFIEVVWMLRRKVCWTAAMVRAPESEHRKKTAGGAGSALGRPTPCGRLGSRNGHQAYMRHIRTGERRMPQPALRSCFTTDSSGVCI